MKDRLPCFRRLAIEGERVWDFVAYGAATANGNTQLTARRAARVHGYAKSPSARPAPAV